jgi:hypothetical protein
MRAVLIILGQSRIQVVLEFVDRGIHRFAKGGSVELVEQRLMKPFDDAVGLRTLGLGSGVINVLNRQVQRVFLAFRVAAIIQCLDRSKYAAGGFPAHRIKHQLLGFV